MSSFHSDPHHRPNGSTVYLDPWGDAIRFRCGHELVVLGVHDLLGHDHACPVHGSNDCGIRFTSVPNDTRTKLEI